MPKRAKTPTIEDDAKYLTVVRPYPAHPNMELEDHRREFARWIASCTGAFYLRAFYHKPTSPGSVIIEIDETFPEFKRLLGAHKWSEFLVEPNDEAHFVSKIFYCTWNSDRDVQKNGWKRVDVQDKWFRSKAPSKFVSPYPTTHWCEVPPTSPPPPPEPVPVVGTPEWQAWKERQKTRVVTARTRAVLPSTQTAPPVTSAPSVASTPPISRAASSSGSSVVEPLLRQAWRNATTPVLPPGLLPGITRGNSSSGSSQPSATGSSAWGEPAASNGSTSPLPPPSSAGTSSGDDALPETPRDAGPEQSSMVAGSHVEGAFAALSVDDYEDDMYYSVDGEGAIANRETDVPAGTIDVLYLPRADALIVNNAPGGSGTGKLPANSDDDNDNDNDNDSDNDDEEEEEAKDPGMIGDKKVCPEHNVVCRKGICRVYAAMLREERREEERQKREKERAEAQAKREKAQKKKGKNSFFKPMPSLGPTSPTGSYGGGRAPPPHLLAGAPAPSPTIRAPPPHLIGWTPRRLRPPAGGGSSV
ncbi:hypothetical protein BN946_scf184936.g22 [Trametes cinnabarina]|uniref:Uncharacterized protein n=1 Tax=Pycnoporus cinnabarinus TaxID=5643 RepID=A0A060SSS9_PYCCI|nr:hypothetical protein BN946_scf184936.g22 [Trametes cinnabarina]